METNELRIGNWIKWHDHIHKIEGIINWGKIEIHLNYTSENDEAFICRDIEEIIPIPLTKEWLTKLGFEVHGKMWQKEFGCILLDRSVRFSLFADKNAKKFFYMDVIQIEYVHQLQNLFYSIGGKELTYEL